MPWFKSVPAVSSTGIPDYGATSTYNITNASQEVVAAGAKGRIISVSTSDDADDIYVNLGAAVDVATGAWKYRLFAGQEDNKLEISSQSVNMATASAGLTATVRVSVAG